MLGVGVCAALKNDILPVCALVFLSRHLSKEQSEGPSLTSQPLLSWVGTDCLKTEATVGPSPP